MRAAVLSRFGSALWILSAVKGSCVFWGVGGVGFTLFVSSVMPGIRMRFVMVGVCLWCGLCLWCEWRAGR